MRAEDAVGHPLLIVETVTNSEWTVTSSPVPVVSVLLFRHGDFWYYRDATAILSPAAKIVPTRQITSAHGRERYFHEALKAVSDSVTVLSRYRWKEHFTGPQRYAMGQQKCPFRMGMTLCRQTPRMGSVWCEWHPLGVAIAR